jgi:hypothetical protein
MNRHLRLPSLAFVLLLACGLGFAQKRSQAPPEPPPKDDLQQTIEWLGVQLKYYGRVNFASPSEPGVQHRKSFDGMRTDGCTITYRIKTVSTYPPGNNFTGGASYREFTVDLKALEPSLVKAEKPKSWSGGRITFGSKPGERAVTERINGKVMEYDSGEFFISEAPAVDVIADALRQAITMCGE